MDERPIRSFAKGISWRAVGTLDTILLSFLVTGQVSLAFSIGVLELVTKFILYYLHERVWTKIEWGMTSKNSATESYQVDLAGLVHIAEAAGRKISEIYHSEDAGEFTRKGDDSPLTKADEASHAYIEAALQKLYPEIPIISEEGKALSPDVRRTWETCWQVDPLDGTKEFLKRNGEFTVNIALIHQGETVAGVIHAPELQLTAWAQRGQGAFMKRASGQVEKLVSRIPQTGEKLRLVASRSHMSAEVEAYVNQFRETEIRSAGSSLKFLLVASGEAHIYPRLAPTMEWDTSAGQIILEEAGGQVLVAQTQKPLSYNRLDMLNPHFIAYGAGMLESLNLFKK